MDFMMLFDRQYVAEGLVCLESILRHGPQSRVFVLCLDFVVEQALANKERVVSIRRVDLETRYPTIAATKSTRPWAPYTQSLKPFLPEFIFDAYGVKTLTYVDSDVLFWGDCEEIDKEMEGYSFMVTSRELDPPPSSGYFNGGFFSCRNDQNCHMFLKWWQKRCVEWCLWTAGPDGKFGEEGYLNIFKTDPQKFKGVHVSRHPGFNLAHWNVRKHKVEQSSEGFVVDGRFPLVCYHYQAFRKETSDFRAHPSVSPEISEMLYRPYHDLIPLETKMPLKEGPPPQPKASDLLYSFRTADGPIKLRVGSFEEVPQEIAKGASADPLISDRLSRSFDQPCVLISYYGNVIGFFTPYEQNGVYGMPIYIDPKYRGQGIGRAVISMYMVGKRGEVGIDVGNEASQRAFTAAGFSSMGRPAQRVGDRLIKIWTKA